MKFDFILGLLYFILGIVYTVIAVNDDRPSYWIISSVWFAGSCLWFTLDMRSSDER